MLHRPGQTDAQRKLGRAGAQSQHAQRRPPRRDALVPQRAGGQREQPERARAQRPRQALPRPARDPRGHRRLAPAQRHHQRAGQHHQREGHQRHVQHRQPQPQAVVDRHQRQAGDGAASHCDMRARHRRLAGDHMVQVDEIALRDGQQPAPGHRRGQAGAPERRAPRGADRQRGHRQPEHRRDGVAPDPGRGGRQDGIHAQKSLQRRSAS